MTTKDPLDVMEAQLREIQLAAERLQQIPETDVDVSLVWAELKETFVPLLSDFMVLSFNELATTREYIHAEIEPILTDLADRQDDPSELALEDAEMFSELIEAYKKHLEAALEATDDEGAQAAAKDAIDKCEAALGRIEEITIEEDEEEDEEGDAEDEEEDPAAADDEPPPGVVPIAAARGQTTGEAPTEPPEPTEP